MPQTPFSWKITYIDITPPSQEAVASPQRPKGGCNKRTRTRTWQPGDGNGPKAQHVQAEVIKLVWFMQRFPTTTRLEVNPPRVRLLGAHNQHQTRLPTVTTIRFLVGGHLHAGGGGGERRLKKGSGNHGHFIKTDPLEQGVEPPWAFKGCLGGQGKSQQLSTNNNSERLAAVLWDYLAVHHQHRLGVAAALCRIVPWHGLNDPRLGGLSRWPPASGWPPLPTTSVSVQMRETNGKK